MLNYKCYISKGGKNEIREWFESCEAGLRGKVSSQMDDLRLSDKKFWPSLGAKFVKGKGKGLCQINIKHQGNEFRLLGYLDEIGDFVFCTCFPKKNNSDNERAYERAQKRRKQIERNEAATEKYNFSVETSTWSITG